jgi:hypothetical protein
VASIWISSLRISVLDIFFYLGESFLLQDCTYRQNQQNEGDKDMIYTKNVPNWERAVRVIVSLGGAAVAYNAGLGVLISGAIASFALTGFFGFCPMCAMVGRKLDKNRSPK